MKKAETKVDSTAKWSVAMRAGHLVALMVAMMPALRGVMKAVLINVSKDACSAEKMVGKMADLMVDWRVGTSDLVMVGCLVEAMDVMKVDKKVDSKAQW